MGEVPLYLAAAVGLAAHAVSRSFVQGYLASEKPPPPLGPCSDPAHTGVPRS